MKSKTIKLIIFLSIFFICNFAVFSVEFSTITEALNYTGDKNVITKITITGNIIGSDYSANSE
jgi:hypothetical protein